MSQQYYDNGVPIHPELTPDQSLALSLLLQGVSKQEIAERVGVTRQTVYNWAKKPAAKRVLEGAIKDRLFYADTELLANVQEVQRKLFKFIQDDLDPKYTLEAIKLYLGYADRIRKNADATWTGPDDVALEVTDDELIGGLMKFIETKQADVRQSETVQ